MCNRFVPRAGSASIQVASSLMSDSIVTPAELVRIEAAALQALADRLDGAQREPMERAAAILADTVRAGHSVVLTGIGKSGLIAQKIAATMRSTGTRAHFLHPTEALHGDLGLLAPHDVLVALSYSGETDEVLRILPVLPRLEVGLISICGCAGSTLARKSAVTLDVSVDREACNHQLAPTASTTAMLALGDALALDVSRRLNFQPRDFAELHPGGHLGRLLVSVRQLMHTGDTLPQVALTATMPQLIHEMSAKRLGMTTVVSSGKLAGVVSDGDLRRLFERNGPYAFHKAASEVMNAHPVTVGPDMLAREALALMEERKITALLVTEDGTQNSLLMGIVHLHDLWEMLPGAVPSPAAEQA